MAMAGGRGGTPGGRRATGGTPGKAVMLIELKHRILAMLHKLSDRDTQQLAVEELERTAQSLSPEGIALFLTCLYDTDAQQKSVVRRESIRLVGTLATIHGDSLACHLPKMVGNIVKRLKDPDSNIRDACVETIGILASQIGGADAGSATTVFVKPLLEALAEQHRTLQIGAAMCLARVIECVKDPHPPTLQRLSPRVVKMLASPNFLAKASLLNAVGVMVQVPGVVSTSQLPILLASVQEELDNNEWAVRKAAADTMSCMATAAGDALASYRGGVLVALENIRFDKVKPVRDSVGEALLLWKAIYDPNAPQSGTPSGSHDSASPRCLEGDSTPTLTDRKNSSLMKSGGSVTSSLSDSSGRPKSLSERRVNAMRKKTPSLSDRKTNPDFFRKLEGVRDSVDWQIEVAVPRDSPQADSPRAGVASNERLVYQHGNRTEAFPGSASPASGYAAAGMLISEESNGTDLHYDQEEGGQLNQPAEIGDIASNGYEDPKSAMLLDTSEKPKRWGDPLHRNGHQRDCSWDANISTPGGSDKATVDTGSVLQRHFHSLERQQLSMMEMLQDSMARVHESMQDLEGRVSRLEQIVENMAHSASGHTEARAQVGESPRFRGNHPLGKYHSGNNNGFLSFKTGKTTEDKRTQDRGQDRGQDQAQDRGQDSMEKMIESTSEELDDFTFGAGHQMPPAAEALTWRPTQSPLQKGNTRDDVELEHLGTRRDRTHAGTLQGEGPSARSVWHASKDEAIAAIRGAAIPSRPHLHRKSHSGRDFTTDQKPARVVGGPFWMLWSRAMESVRSGDLDGAFVEILGSSDELLLVRLMGRTGPVLEQLSAGTVAQLMGSIKQFLQQQSFLDCIIPWIQQVSDLVSTSGPDALGLMDDTRKDLVFALQEATSVEYAQSWMGAKIAELAELLGNAWSSSGSGSTVDR